MYRMTSQFLPIATLLGLAALLLQQGASAQEAEQDEVDEGIEQEALSTVQMRGLHSKLDKNGDGKVSMDEAFVFSDEMRRLIAAKDIHTVLEEMDLDKDGQLGLDELLKDMEQWGEGDEEDSKEAKSRKELETAKFKVADTNGDNKLSVEELPALFYPETHEGVLELTATATLKSKDSNGDGLLTPKEFWEGDSVDGDEFAITEEEQADFQKLDTDRDGSVSLSELKTWESGRFHTEEAMKKLFQIADKDSDMHVTADELDSAREQIAGSDAQYHLMEWAEHHEL